MLTLQLQSTIIKSYKVQNIFESEVVNMAQALRKKDIEDAKKISTIFSTLSEESKTIAVIYLSALRDKEIADGERVRCVQ